MKKVLRFFLALGIVTLSLLTLFVPQAQAIESFGIGAIPANPNANNPRTQSIFIHSAKPGEIQNDGVKVVNNSETKRTLRVYAVDSTKSSDGAFACEQAVETRDEVGSWLALEKTEVILEPHTNEIVPFTLSVPAGAEVGEHNGCIAIEEVKEQQSTNSNGIAISFRSAIRVAIVIPGEINANLTFDTLESTQRATSLVISSYLRNKGNISVDATVRVELRNALNSLRAHSEGQFAILTDNDTRINFDMPAPFWGGWYRLSSQTDYKQLSQTGTGTEKEYSTQGPSSWVYIAPQPLAMLIYVLIVIGGAGVVVWVLFYRRQIHLLQTTTRHYTIEAGDSLPLLASKAGISWKKIARINKIKAPYTLEVGQKIKLPKKQPNKTRAPKHTRTKD